MTDTAARHLFSAADIADGDLKPVLSFLGWRVDQHGDVASMVREHREMVHALCLGIGDSIVDAVLGADDAKADRLRSMRDRLEAAYLSLRDR